MDRQLYIAVHVHLLYDIEFLRLASFDVFRGDFRSYKVTSFFVRNLYPIVFILDLFYKST